MEIKVRAVPGPGEKSLQEVEETLMEQVQEDAPVEETSIEDTPVQETSVEDTPVETSTEYGEDELRDYIKNRYNREIENIDDLFAEKQQEELPEDVSAFLKYKKETGRDIKDFMKLQVDYDQVDDNKLLQDFYSSTEEDLDSEDISYLIQEKFGYDEDVDDDSDIKAKKIAVKRELAKAKKYFNELKETYKIPVESAKGLVNDDELETYNAYKEYVSQSQSVQEENQKKTEFFMKKTEEVFNDEFKGFEFNVGEQSILFSPGEVSDVKSAQSDVNNFISKYIDEKGLIKDPKGYHRALSAAMNPEKMANFFYEKGKADSVGDLSRQSKNVNMDVRTTPQQVSTSGFKVRAVESDSGRGLKIKKR
jgi:hypothetical protein